MLIFLVNSWREHTKKDGFVAETSNNEPKIYINRRQERERDDAHTGRWTQRTRKRGARDARALRCDYASFMLGLSKDVTFEPWMDQDALIDWVEHIKPIVLRMRPAARL